MAQDGVIPANDLNDEGVRNVYFPDVVALRQETKQINAGKVYCLVLFWLCGADGLQLLVGALACGDQLEIQRERRIVGIDFGVIDKGFVKKEIVLKELFLVPDGRKGETRKAREAVGFEIGGTGEVEELGMEIFDKETPTEYAGIGVSGREGKVAVIGVDADLGAKEKGTKGAQGFNHGQEFFFDGGVVLLCSGELAAVVSDGVPVLFDHSTKLQIGSIGVDVERQIGIRVAEKYIFGDERFRIFEGTLALRGPYEGNILAGEGSDGSKKISTAAEYVAIEGNGTTEGSNSRSVGRRSDMQDGFNLLAPRLGSSRGEPKAKEICFRDGPFAFDGIDGEDVV